MAWLDQPDGSRLEVFGSGGGERVADRLTEALGVEVTLLGQVPLDIAAREAGDAGTPVVLSSTWLVGSNCPGRDRRDTGHARPRTRRAPPRRHAPPSGANAPGRKGGAPFRTPRHTAIQKVTA